MEVRRTTLFALGAALAGSLFLPLVRMIGFPLHREGIAQPPLSILNGLAAFLHFPASYARLEAMRYFSPSAPLVGRYAPHAVYLLTNFVICFLLGAAAYVFYRACRPRKALQLAENAAAEPADACVGTAPLHSRRRFLEAGACGVALAGSAAASYSFLVQPRWFRVTRRQIAIRGLPAQLDGLRLAQLTDIHLGPWLSVQHVRHVVAATNELKPDLIVLTGDYVHDSPAYIKPVADALAQLRAEIGVLAVLGNHDWWEDGPQSQKEFARVGIPLIDNDRIIVTPGRRLEADAAEGLCIAGVGDLWEDVQLYDAALGGLPEQMPRVLLSHNPDVAEEEPLGRHRVDLMMSGHTHGGQIRLPLVNPVASVSQYGDKYTYGLVDGPFSKVLISSGIGMVGVPLRIGTRPEIVLVELKSKKD